MDIFEDLNDIPALADFQASPAAPPESDGERVRAFLRERCGSSWQRARIYGYVTIAGESVYVAMLPPTHGIKQIQLVSEDANGTLAQSAPVPLDLPEDEDNIIPFPSARSDVARKPGYEDERDCLDQILPALADASRIIEHSPEVKFRRKKRILAELTHAASHLLHHLEHLRQAEQEK